MTDIQWKNVKDGLCIVCKISLDSSNSDIESHQKITCGDYCHEKFILQMIKEHGMFKKVVDITSGINYKVPTRLIIEDGLRQQDLKNYPTW